MEIMRIYFQVYYILTPSNQFYWNAWNTAEIQTSVNMPKTNCFKLTCLPVLFLRSNLFGVADLCYIFFGTINNF